jgi:hypothetical protein
MWGSYVGLFIPLFLLLLSAIILTIRGEGSFLSHLNDIARTITFNEKGWFAGLGTFLFYASTAIGFFVGYIIHLIFRGIRKHPLAIVFSILIILAIITITILYNTNVFSSDNTISDNINLVNEINNIKVIDFFNNGYPSYQFKYYQDVAVCTSPSTKIDGSCIALISTSYCSASIDEIVRSTYPFASQITKDTVGSIGHLLIFSSSGGNCYYLT